MNADSLRSHLVGGGQLRQNGNQYHLAIPPTSDALYTDAQLDDYPHALPHTFSNRPPQIMRLRARFSSAGIKGTAGFGYWNHPFSRTGAVIAPPANVWFFYSSEESDLQIARGAPTHGLKASVLNSGQYPVGLFRVLARPLNWLLGVPRLSRVLFSFARSAIRAEELPLHIDMTEWHDYEIDWRKTTAILRVDQQEVLCASHPPTMPLGFAAWIDNYRATADSSGKYAFAYVPVVQEQWLELEIMSQHV
jgi:hypothetical protein